MRRQPIPRHRFRTVVGVAALVLAALLLLAAAVNWERQRVLHLILAVMFLGIGAAALIRLRHLPEGTT